MSQSQPQSTLFPIDSDPLATAAGAPKPWTPKLTSPPPTPAAETAACFDCNGVDPTCPSCHGTQRVPVAKVNQIRAKIVADLELHPSVRGHVAALLYAAGTARDVDGVTVGGMTIQELAVAVSERRGRATKETTITQPLADLRDGGFVSDSGLSRVGNAGVANTVWEHTYIITNPEKNHEHHRT